MKEDRKGSNRGAFGGTLAPPDNARPLEPLTGRPIDWRFLIVASIPVILGTYLVLEKIETHFFPSFDVETLRMVHFVRGVGFTFLFALLAAIGIERNWRYAIKRLKIAEATMMNAERTRTHQERLAAVGRLAAGVAHEIGNPLASIAGMTHMLRKKGWDERSLERIDVIDRQVTRISEIIHRLSDLADTSFHRPEQIDLEQLANSVVKLISYDPEADDLHVDVAVEPIGLTVEGIPSALNQALFQVLLNAAEASRWSGVIHTEAYEEGKKVFIEVVDSGRGIPAEVLDRIFDPFFTTKSMGTGLGLPVARSLIASMQGTMEVESSVGKGTLVRIMLPKNRTAAVIGY